MTIPTDEELVKMSQDELIRKRVCAKMERSLAGKLNRWKQHQELGDLLCKLDQLINQ